MALSDKVFSLNSGTEFKTDNLLEFIKTNGGKVERNVTKKVNYLLCGEDLKISSKTKTAMKYGIPILKEQFVIDSVNKGKLLDVSKYKLVETNEDDDDDTDDGWVRYNEEQSEILEAAYQKDPNNKSVKIDSQRYVDFHSMFQRRFDDPEKMRAVKRVGSKKPKPKKKAESEDEAEEKVPKKAKPDDSDEDKKKDEDKDKDMDVDEDEKKDEEEKDKDDEAKKKKVAVSGDMFDDLVFYFVDDLPEISDYTEKIEAVGGFVSGTFSKRVTHIISSTELSTKQEEQAQEQKCKVVTIDFLDDSFAKNKKMNEDDYSVGGNKSKKRKAAEKSKSSSDSEEEKPAVVWRWYSDNGWEDYDPKLCKKLEAAYQNGETKVRVDDERYVDIPFMLQRRYDDANRQRNVSRVAPKKQKKKEAADESEFKKYKAPSANDDKVKAIKKGHSVVDVHCDLAKTCHVLEEGSIIWDAMLNQTDIGYGQKGSNKFYVIQLLESDTSAKYWLWTRWGRVGVPGQSKKESCSSKDEAKKLFKKKFMDKTGNSWDNKKNFQKKPGKYQLVEIDYDNDDDDEEKKPNKSDDKKVIKIPDSKLPPSVRDLISLICDIKNMKSVMMELEIDIKKMPLGKLSKTQIKKGYEILKEIGALLNQGGNYNKLVDCSNRFYTLIPHDTGFKAPPVINNLKLLQSKLEMLEALTDMEIASKLLDKGKEALDENPIDTQYKALHTQLTPVASNSDTWNMLNDYIQNTHAATHNQYTLELMEVFEVNREGETEKFKPWKEDKNRMLLWHGSRLTNWVGILSQGLRIAPPEAPVTGYMFGKGVYFADLSSKSANYCHTNKQNPIGILILCEVALGNMYRKRQAEMIVKLPPGYQSCMGEGQYQPDPDDYETLEDGTKVPLGKIKPTGLKPTDTALMYNEFIVYDTSQIKIRYLLKMNFKYK